MGKKGKRSKQKAVTAADRDSIYDVSTQIAELHEKFNKSNGLHLYSQAVNELREGIQLIEATMLKSSNTLLKMNLQAWFDKSKTICYANLMMVEFSRRNFGAAIHIYKKLFETGNIKMKMKILSHDFPSLQLQYHTALLRQGKGSIETFISISQLRITHSHKYCNNLECDLLRSANILRTTKHFEAAIVLGKQLEELTGDKVSLATTYLEQYLVEYYPKYGRNINSPPDNFKDIFKNMGSAFESMIEKHKNGGFNTANAGSLLVLAQSTYLLHQFSSHDTEIIMGKAIGFIEEYLDLFSNAETHCITCTQTATESEVQLVCSGCRVACYCSIDHQRMSWKKEAVRGMCIGHEVLCPVMKAYRKWRHAYDNGDIEQVSRLRRRFERECLYLLSDGLGLKDKCLDSKKRQTTKRTSSIGYLFSMASSFWSTFDM